MDSNLVRVTPTSTVTEAIPVRLMVGTSGSSFNALRSIGSDLGVYVDDMNADAVNNSGMSSAALQTAFTSTFVSTNFTTHAKQDTLIAQGAGSSTYLHQALTNTSVSAIGGTSAVVKRVVVSNPTGTGAYFRMYDNLGAAVLGTDTPKIVIWIAAGATNSVELDATFANGVSLACTGAAGDSANDAGGPVISHVIYQ